MDRDRDLTIIRHVIEHSQDIIDARNRFGNDFIYFNAVCMSLLQIGELAMQGHGDIQWKAIIGMRNIVVHGKERIWATVNEDIPVLLYKCKEIMGLYDK